MKRYLSLGLMAAVALVTASLFTSVPAYAAGGLGTQTELHNNVNCTTWVNPPAKVYPSDDAHYWVCTSPAHPTFNAQRADSIATLVQGWNSSANESVAATAPLK